MPSRPEVCVLGGGIAGLAVALALARRGVAVTVLEQAARIAEAGAGLQISPNGAAVLRGLGLGAELARIGLRASAIELRSGINGAPVLRMDLAALRSGQDYLFCHRADLIGLLETAARAAGVTLSLGQAVSSVDLASPSPRLHFADGNDLTVPFLVGADGVHSLVRAALNPASVPFFTGQVAWRALIDVPGQSPPVAEVYMGPGRHLVSYPLRGGALRNLVAVEERARWASEGWHHRDDPANLRAAFASFGGAVPGWLDAAHDVHLWGLFRHPVAPVWSGPAVAILGDAAHPTLPFLAQGANMALEDAWVLADCLASGADLASYQSARERRVRRIVQAASDNAHAYHLRGPARFAAHLGLRLTGTIAPGLALRRYDWLYGHDVTTPAAGGQEHPNLRALPLNHPAQVTDHPLAK